MDIAINMTLEYTTIGCCSCGIVFAVTRPYEKKLRESHKTFYCPNGHGQHFLGLSEAARLQKELDETVSANAVRETKLKKRMGSLVDSCESKGRNLTSVKRSLTAHKGLVTKLRKQLAEEKVKNTPLVAVEDTEEAKDG